MSPTEAELAYLAAQRALPDFRFGRDQLVQLLRALPPPPPDAPVAWRHAHLRAIIQEVLALDPRNPLDAMLVLQIIAARHAAAHTARRSLDPTASAQQAAKMLRGAEGLLRAAQQTERQLKRQQAGRVSLGHPPAEAEFDLEALDAIWCEAAPPATVPDVDPAGLRSGGHAGVGAPSPAAPTPIERVKYTLCGQRIDLVRLVTIPAAGSA